MLEIKTTVIEMRNAFNGLIIGLNKAEQRISEGTENRTQRINLEKTETKTKQKNPSCLYRNKHKNYNILHIRSHRNRETV